MEWSDGAEESTWEQPFAQDVQQSYRRGYYAAAAYSDSLFGELMVTLEQKGFSNNTIVIMTAVSHDSYAHARAQSSWSDPCDTECGVLPLAGLLPRMYAVA